MNKNIKSHSLMYNSIFNVLFKSLNILFPLITAAYIARVLESTQIGEVLSAQNIAQYFVLAAALGLPSYGTREIAKVRDNDKELNKTFTELFALNGISTFVCLISYIILIFLVPAFSKNLILFLVTGLNIVFNFINVDWIYQGCEQYRYIAIRSFIIKLCALICVLLFVRNSNDYIIYALLSSLAICGNNICNIAYLRKMNVRITFEHLVIFRHIKPVLSLFCTTLAIEIYTLLDTTMISALCTKENVTFYNYSMRITRALIVVVAAIGGVLLPRLTYYYKRNELEQCKKTIENVLNILLFLLIPCCVWLFTSSREVILTLYGNDYIPSISVLKISTLLIVTLGFSNLFGTQILVTFGKENKLLLATIIGAISNTIMNYFLIRIYQGKGAAVASVISETLVTLITFYYARNAINFKIDLSDLLSIILSSIFMGIGLIFIKSLCNNVILCLILEIIVAGMIYIPFTYLLKNSTSRKYVKILLDKVIKKKET